MEIKQLYTGNEKEAFYPKTLAAAVYLSDFETLNVELTIEDTNASIQDLYSKYNSLDPSNFLAYDANLLDEKNGDRLLASGIYYNITSGRPAGRGTDHNESMTYVSLSKIVLPFKSDSERGLSWIRQLAIGDTTGILSTRTIQSNGRFDWDAEHIPGLIYNPWTFYVNDKASSLSSTIENDGEKDILTITLNPDIYKWPDDDNVPSNLKISINEAGSNNSGIMSSTQASHLDTAYQLTTDDNHYSDGKLHTLPHVINVLDGINDDDNVIDIIDGKIDNIALNVSQLPTKVTLNIDANHPVDINAASTTNAGVMTNTMFNQLDKVYDEYMLRLANVSFTINTNAVYVWYNDSTTVSPVIKFNSNTENGQPIATVLSGTFTLGGNTASSTSIAANVSYQFPGNWNLFNVVSNTSATSTITYTINNKTKQIQTSKVLAMPTYKIFVSWVNAATPVNPSSLYTNTEINASALSNRSLVNTDKTPGAKRTYNTTNPINGNGSLLILIPSEYNTESNKPSRWLMGGQAASVTLISGSFTLPTSVKNSESNIGISNSYALYVLGSNAQMTSYAANTTITLNAE